MYIYPHKRNVDALLKVGVILKVVVFRTICCVVARIALATECCCCCCCCWSIHRVRQQLIDDSVKDIGIFLKMPSHVRQGLTDDTE